MTAFVIDLRADKLSIASDTLGYIVGVDGPAKVAPVGLVSKVYTFPWLRAALFGRRITAIGARTAAALYTSPQTRRFADAMGALPLILRRTTNAYSDEFDIDDPFEVQLLRGRILRLGCRGAADARGGDQQLWRRIGYDREELPAGMVGTFTVPQLPPEFAGQELKGLPLDRRLVEGLHRCKAWVEDNPERNKGVAIVGGEIERTEITPDGISVRTIGRFADYEQVHAGAAVLARFARGDLDADVRDGLARVDEMVTAGGAAVWRHLPKSWRSPRAPPAPSAQAHREAGAPGRPAGRLIVLTVVGMWRSSVPSGSRAGCPCDRAASYSTRSPVGSGDVSTKSKPTSAALSPGCMSG